MLPTGFVCLLYANSYPCLAIWHAHHVCRKNKCFGLEGEREGERVKERGEYLGY